MFAQLVLAQSCLLSQCLSELSELSELSKLSKKQFQIWNTVLA